MCSSVTGAYPIPIKRRVLRELIHYLSSTAAGAVGFEDMGDKWVKVRNDVRDGSFRRDDAAAREVAERWEQFTHYLCLTLSQELGTAVTAQRPRNQTTAERLSDIVTVLGETGDLTCTVRIPDAVGPLTITADLRSRQTSASVSIDAPRAGRVRARFNWLIRQLRQASDDLLVEASFANVRTTTAVRLGEVRDDPSLGFYPADPKREPRGFVLTQTKPMGQKRGRAEGSFVRETTAQTVGFYRDIIQHLKAWQPSAPQIHTDAGGNDDGTEREVGPQTELADRSAHGSVPAGGPTDPPEESAALPDPEA